MKHAQARGAAAGLAAFALAGAEVAQGRAGGGGHGGGGGHASSGGHAGGSFAGGGGGGGLIALIVIALIFWFIFRRVTRAAPGAQTLPAAPLAREAITAVLGAAAGAAAGRGIGGLGTGALAAPSRPGPARRHGCHAPPGSGL